MSSMSSFIPVSHLTTQVDTVNWSQDQRISVTTNEAIYVLTLRGVCYAHSSTTHPPLTISIASAPSRHTLLPLGGSTTMKREYVPKLGSMTSILDPVFASGRMSCQSCDFYVASDWSPAGCNHLGGCLLSALTFSGRLLLFSPLGTTSYRWRMITDVTHLYSTLLTANHTQQQADCEEPPSKIPKANSDNLDRTNALTCVAHAWLPTLLPSSGDGGTAVVAMATRSGCVILWTLQVPLPAKSSAGGSVGLALLRVLELPLPKDTWVCSLRWHPVTTVHLTAGCTNGMVLDFHWESLTTDAAGKIPEPGLTPLWPHADSIPVHHIVWQTKPPSQEQCWVVINKGSSLVALSSPETAVNATPPHALPSLPPLPPHLLVCGLHSMPVSGLCFLSDSTFISSSLDGTLQRFTLPTPTPPSHQRSHDSHVTPEPIATLSPGETYTIQGLAVSQNAVFAAIAVNPQDDFSYNKKKYRSRLHFVDIAGGRQVEKRLEQRVVCEWDICEHLRQQFAQTMELPLSIQKLITRWAVNPSVPQLQLQLQMHHISQKAGTDRQCVVLVHSILQRHITSTLQSWQLWTKEGGTTDSQGAVSLQLMCKWLLSAGDTQLAQEVAAALPAESQDTEVCPLCGASIPLTNPQEEECENGHKWKRCSVTLCLATDPQCSVCVQCETTANNTQSLETEPGMWLHHLLLANPRCVLCNGHFAQLV